MRPPLKITRLLVQLGYGVRRDAEAFLHYGRLTRPDGTPYRTDEKVVHADVLFDGAPLDPDLGLVAVLNKPLGFTCSTADPGRIVYDLLPPRWKRRDPIVSIAGRLDKDSSGLVLLTDDGQLLHKIISPKKQVWKTYRATLARPLSAEVGALFASGTLMLEGETTPLKPAQFLAEDATTAWVRIQEGKYHQVRRMFAATGNHVTALQRTAIGALGLGSMGLGDLAEGEWRLLSLAERAALFEPPPPLG